MSEVYFPTGTLVVATVADPRYDVRLGDILEITSSSGLPDQDGEILVCVPKISGDFYIPANTIKLYEPPPLDDIEALSEWLDA